MELSYHARMLPAFLLMHADDTGRLAPVSERGHPAKILAQVLSIGSRNRRAFYHEIEDLLDYGDDGEPLSLVVRDGHYTLTRFEECQANRNQVSHRGVDATVTEHLERQSAPSKGRESFNTQTDLVAEERRKKKEERLSTSTTINESHGDVEAVLAHWHAAELDPFSDVDDDSRRRLIGKRLSSHTVGELKAAIDGAKRSTALRKRDLPAIFRDTETIKRLATPSRDPQPEPEYGRQVAGADETALALHLQDQGVPDPWGRAREILRERRDAVGIEARSKTIPNEFW